MKTEPTDGVFPGKHRDSALTKREFMAALICASVAVGHSGAGSSTTINAVYAVAQADALIEALNKEQG